MINIDKIPVEYRPMSPIKYFLYGLLFSIPVIGLVFIIFFSYSHSNISRKNFAKSYFYTYIIILIAFVIFGLTGGFAHIIDALQLR